MVKSRVFLGIGNLPPLIGNPYNGYINPYYWVDDHPLLYGNNRGLDPIAHMATLKANRDLRFHRFSSIIQAARLGFVRTLRNLN